MRRRTKRDFADNVPLEIECILAVIALVISAVAVPLGAIAFYLIINHAIANLFAGIGAVQQITIPIPTDLWPLLLIAIAVVSMRIYVLLRAHVARSMSVL